MADTFTQIYVQGVFSVNGRQNLIPAKHEEELYKYMAGILKPRTQKVLAIGGMPDHVHVFFSMLPSIALADLMRDLKTGSSSFIKRKGWGRGRFSWQKGYGAFSYSRSQVDRVCYYIRNQKAHHARKSFRTEYLQMLRQFEVEYDERYLFDWIDDA